MPDNPKPSKSSKGSLLSKIFRSHPTAPNIGNAVFLAGLSGVAPIDRASTLSSAVEQMPSEAVDLSLAKTGLTLLSTLGEGFTGIPGIKAAASIALQIVVAVETAQSNKDACRSTALRVYQTMHSIAKGSQDGQEGIQSHIREFERDLVKILDIIQALTTQKPHTQVLQGNAVAQNLQECDRLLTHATTLFSVKVQIHQANLQSQQMASLTKIVRKLDNPDKETPLPNLLITASLPPPPTHFVGRDDLVDEGVNHIISSTSARIAILGQGGIGKTTLSLAIVHNKVIKDCFGPKCFFLPCETLKTGHDLVSGILQVLSVSSLDSTQDPLDFLYKQLVATGKSLLVIDNFETLWFGSPSQDLVERVLQIIASVDTITLIVTMRGDPAPTAVDWTIVLPSEGLGPLSLNAAKDMYLKLSKYKLTDPQSLQSLETLLTEVDYVPLAVTLLAALGRTYPPQKLYACWKKNQTELLKAPGSQLTKQTSVAFSIDLSLQSSILIHNHEAFRLLAIIAFLPAGIPQWSDLIEEITAGFEDVYNAADVLCQTSMVFKTNNGALSMLSPTRHHINSRKDLNIDNHVHDLGALVYFISESIRNRSQNLVLLGQFNIIHILTKWLELDSSSSACKLVFDCSEYLFEKHIEVTNLMELVIPILRSSDAEVLLADCIMHYCVLLERRQYIAEEIEINAVCDIYSKYDHKFGLAQATDFLGFVFFQQGQYEKAVEKHMVAYNIFEQLNHISGMIACLENWASSLEKQQKYEEIMEKFKIIIELASKTEDNNLKASCFVEFAEFLKRQNKFLESNEQYALAVNLYTASDQKIEVAKYLNFMGINLYAINELEEAIKKHQMAYDIYQKLPGPDLGICVSLMCLSTIWDVMGCINESLQAFATHYSVCEELLKEETPKHQSLMAICSFQYGILLLRIGEYPKAIEKLTVAQEFFSKLNNLDKKAVCLDNIGVLLNTLGEFSQSVEKHAAACAIFEQLNDDNKMIESLKYWKNSLLAQNNYAEAYNIEMKAQLIWIKLNNSMQRAISLNDLGEFLCLQEKYPEAIEMHSNALDLFIQLENPISIAVCLGYWGRTCLQQGDYSEAIVKYTEAYDIYNNLKPLSPATAKFLKEIAFCFEMQGDIEEAQAKYKAAEYVEIWADWLNSWFVPPYSSYLEVTVG